jgi:hypothetical protein
LQSHQFLSLPLLLVSLSPKTQTRYLQTAITVKLATSKTTHALTRVHVTTVYVGTTTYVQEPALKTATAKHNKTRPVTVMAQTAKTNAMLDLESDAALECNEAADKHLQNSAFSFFDFYFLKRFFRREKVAKK